MSGRPCADYYRPTSIILHFAFCIYHSVGSPLRRLLPDTFCRAVACEKPVGTGVLDCPEKAKTKTKAYFWKLYSSRFAPFFLLSLLRTVEDACPYRIVAFDRFVGEGSLLPKALMSKAKTGGETPPLQYFVVATAISPIFVMHFYY